ncbi:MAG: GFA family protein [Sphingopyxis sp.]|uniref:GFA family protein n=1 Tax=Sphingopyxis sp. TaxID=1908224 RepID=UPI002AB9E593|nr:GFA family protein [Sphingopyxis sp.]MDZ3830489.1 GFA family protein [Sphingopyxis sp.]
MTSPTSFMGQCLCGQVKVHIAPPEPHVEACHCGMCRRWGGGGAALSVPMTPDAAFEGAEHIVRYASSEWAERAFCGTCGTHLFYYYKPMASYSLSAGLFEGAADFTLSGEIYIDEKPEYYTFSGERERLTGAQVMEKFGIGNA